MTSKHGPNQRHKAKGNQTALSLYRFAGPINLSNMEFTVKAQVVKEFVWLITNFLNATEQAQADKWAGKMRNWSKNHPDRFVGYLTDVSKRIAEEMGDASKTDDIIFFLAGKMGIKIGYTEGILGLVKQ